MKLSKNNLIEIKSFLDESLNQDVKPDLIRSITLNNSLKDFFYINLLPLLTPDAPQSVINFINALNK